MNVRLSPALPVGNAACVQPALSLMKPLVRARSAEQSLVQVPCWTLLLISLLKCQHSQTLQGAASSAGNTSDLYCKPRVTPDGKGRSSLSFTLWKCPCIRLPAVLLYCLVRTNSLRPQQKHASIFLGSWSWIKFSQSDVLLFTWCVWRSIVSLRTAIPWACTGLAAVWVATRESDGALLSGLV